MRILLGGVEAGEAVDVLPADRHFSFAQFLILSLIFAMSRCGARLLLVTSLLDMFFDVAIHARGCHWHSASGFFLRCSKQKMAAKLTRLQLGQLFVEEKPSDTCSTLPVFNYIQSNQKCHSLHLTTKFTINHKIKLILLVKTPQKGTKWQPTASSLGTGSYWPKFWVASLVTKSLWVKFWVPE